MNPESNVKTGSKLKNGLKYTAGIVGLIVLFLVLKSVTDQYENRASAKAALNAASEIESEYGNPLDPEIEEERGYIGVAQAQITIVEYTDFECPYCSRAYHTMEEVQKFYGDKVRLFVKNLPLPIHKLAMPAARRFEALRVRDSKKAYAYYHEVFANQNRLASEGERFLDEVVTKVGGDLTQLKEDMESEHVTQIIADDIAEAQKFEIHGTPAFIIEGIAVRGAYPFDAFKKVIEDRLAAKAQ